MRKLQFALLLLTLLGSFACARSMQSPQNSTPIPVVAQPVLPQTVYYRLEECEHGACRDGIWYLSPSAQQSSGVFHFDYDTVAYEEPMLSLQTFALSPDGNLIAFVEEAGYAGIRRNDYVSISTVTVDGTERSDYIQYGPNMTIQDLTWSPDGTKLAFVIGSSYSASYRSVGVLDIASREVVVFDAMSAFSWSPDSNQLVVSNAFDLPQGLHVAAVDTREVRPLLLTEETSFEGFLHPTWSPDGSEIAYVSATQFEQPDRLFVVDINTLETTELATGQSILELGWSPDSQQLAFSEFLQEEQQSTLYVIDRSTGIQYIVASDVHRGEWTADSKAMLLIPLRCPDNIRWVDLESGVVETLDIRSCIAHW